MNRYPFYRRLVEPQDVCGKFYPYRDAILGTYSAQRVAIPAMQSRTLTVIYIGNYSMGVFGSEYLGVGTKRLHRSDIVSSDEILQQRFGKPLPRAKQLFITEEMRVGKGEYETLSAEWPICVPNSELCRFC